MPTKKSKTPKKPTHRKKSKAHDRESYHLPVRTEREQFENLPEDLVEAWNELRKFMVSLGEQRIHTSHRSIMFSRETCYAFVRPKKSFLELNVFLPKSLKSTLIKKTRAVSKTKHVNIISVIHRDQIEDPLTEWIREAYQFSSARDQNVQDN